MIEGSDCALEAGERLILSVPATSANMGPGFDCFGFAVDVRNELIVERGTFAIEIEGEGREELPRDETNAIYDAVRAGFEAESGRGRRENAKSFKFFVDLLPHRVEKNRYS